MFVCMTSHPSICHDTLQRSLALPNNVREMFYFETSNMPRKRGVSIVMEVKKYTSDLRDFVR